MGKSLIPAASLLQAGDSGVVAPSGPIRKLVLVRKLVLASVFATAPRRVAARTPIALLLHAE
jgi:hypothetical protein